MKKVSIVGFGRFGKTLYRLLQKDFEITVYDINPVDNKLATKNLSEVYLSDTIFFAVPISSFEKVIKEHKKYFTDKNLLIDVLSVKLHPKKVFEKHLKDTKTKAMLTHPMFGPDSSKKGFNNLPMIVDRFTASKEQYAFWKNYFKSKKLEVIEMSADEHDKLAAKSQGLTHFIGRLLNAVDFEPTIIASMGAKKLNEVMEQTCNDTWELFENLQHYNPYTKAMRIKLGIKYEEIYNKLLPKQVDPEAITIGIQGGRGSFNEEAVMYYLKREGIEKYNIKYLYTSANVMKALHRGEIDRGQMAIYNTLGGMVGETIEAITEYKSKIDTQFAIKISHTLMIRSDAKLSDVDTIMTHPQVLAQCRNSLTQKYPNLKLMSGEGELVDHANVAKHLAENKLTKNIATIGSSVLAEIYPLKVIETNMQDSSDNFTSFLHFTRS